VSRSLAWVAIVAGVLLVVAGAGLLVLAQNLSEFGFASLGDAAPVPIAGIAIGLALLVGGVVTLRRRPAAGG
jgi:hypothetical protein